MSGYDWLMLVIGLSIFFLFKTLSKIINELENKNDFVVTASICVKTEENEIHNNGGDDKKISPEKMWWFQKKILFPLPPVQGQFVSDKSIGYKVEKVCINSDRKATVSFESMEIAESDAPRIIESLAAENWSLINSEVISDPLPVGIDKVREGLL